LEEETGRDILPPEEALMAYPTLGNGLADIAPKLILFYRNMTEKD
jgi:hypothetical protein